MPKTVQMPDGTIRTFPDEATPEQIAAALRSEQKPKPTLQGEAAAVASQATAGVADILGLPVDAVSNALKSVGLISPEVVPFGGAESIQSGIRALGGAVDVEPQTREGQFAGDVARLAGAGGPLSAFNVAKQGARVAPEVANLITSSIGAQTGIEAAQEIAPDSSLAEAGGAILGGGLPSLAKTAATGGVRRALRGADAAGTRENIARLERIGAPATLGDVAESGAARQIQAALQRFPGGRRIINSIERTADGIARRTREITGSSMSPERAGRTIEKGIKGFSERFSNKADQLYNRVNIAPDAPVRVDSTSRALSEMAAPVAGFEKTSKALVNPKVREIASTFAADVADTGQVPFDALKRLRSQIGRQLSNNQIVSDVPRAELKRVYSAISDDLKAAAESAGQLREFNRANDFYKAGIKRIDDQLSNLANKAQPEKVFKAALSGAQDGPSKLRAIRKSLTPEEWEIVAKTQLSRLGKPTPGQAGVDEGFSLNTFLTNYNRLAPESRRVLFKDAKGLDRAVDDIARAVDKAKSASRVGANPSGSAAGIADFATGAALAGGAFNTSLAALAAFGMVGANTAARMFEYPAFIKWVGQSTKLPPNKLAAHFSRLNVVAKDNPEISQEIEEYLRSFGSEQ